MIRRLKEKSRFVKYRAGSALVLVIVITVLLATVGVMFVMMSRVGQVATSTISDNRELSAAVDVVVNRIHTVLVDDLFGVSLDPSDDLHLLAPPTVAGRRPDYSVLPFLNEPWDVPLSNAAFLGLGDDPWLASLEPVEFPLNSGNYYWPHISDIYGIMDPCSVNGRLATIAGPTDANDADGDGVTDSLFVQLPITSSRGEPIFAAVRIVDNCAMLNLNTAHTADPDSDGRYLSAVDYERFLRGNDKSNPERIRRARKCDPCAPIDPADYYHDYVIMNIENPGPDYVLFDIGDELEIRNRYLLTSLTLARFEREDIGYETFDWGRGFFVGGWNPELRVKRIPFDTADFEGWKWRMDHRNFEGDPINPTPDHPEPYKYDRRHVCTFYSFDRNLRRRMYPLVDVINDTVDPNRIDWRLEDNPAPVFTPGHGVPVNINNDISSNTIESRRNILHLLYAFRAYFIDMDPDAGYQAAARRSAQLVANMIDYMDNYAMVGPFYEPRYGGQTNEDSTYDNSTYIDREIVRQLILEVSTYYHDILGIGNIIDIDIQTAYDFGLGADDIVYGYERQPFISELYCYYDSEAPTPGVQAFAIELCNPYENPNGFIDLEGWRIDIGGTSYDLLGIQVDPASAGQLGRMVIKTSGMSVPAPGVPEEIDDFGLSLVTGNIVELQRPNPAWESGDPPEDEFITVDATEPEQTDVLLTPGDGTFVSKRDDTAWKFANASLYTADPCDNTPRLGEENLVSLPGKGFQMPVLNPPLSENKRFATLHDFEMVLFIGNEKIGAEPNAVTRKVGSATSEGDVRFDVESRPELLEYICFMNRPQGNLPGRININTATMEVIRAAIPPNLDWDADNLAMSIINDRIANGPFERIADLLDVRDSSDDPIFQQVPDPNTGDPSIGGDFEEHDWILSRVANIFTVRSDVFTAYILVRIGHDGPQKRMIAIFDRSNVFLPADRPRLVALHPVPDPR